MMSKDKILNIGGFISLTTIDYPGHLSAVVFCQGCPFSCRYCHNQDLRKNTKNSMYSWEEISLFLQSRQGLLDAVVFSGGEPCLQGGLLPAIEKVKAMGFKVGLHTTGIYPNKLKQILPYTDWIGLDIKTSFNQYKDITGVPGSGDKAKDCIKMITASDVDCTYRTTFHPLLQSEKQILLMAKELKALGANNFTLQLFNRKGCTDEQLCYQSVINISDALNKALSQLFSEYHLQGGSHNLVESPLP